MKKYIVLACALTIYTTSCHTTKPAAVSNENIVANMQNKYANYTLAEFNDGKKMYTQNCGSCHDLKNPTSFSESQWKKIVPPMCEKVNEKELVLNAEKQELILKYLVSMTTMTK